MSKAEGSFSGMRKYLEQKMIAPAWKGRVRYNCSTAVGMDGCRFFELYIDNVCVKRFSWETVNSYFIENGIAEKKSPMDTRDYWEDFWDLMAKYPMDKRTEYTDTEFCEALEKYRNGKISESIHSPDPLAVMFALLERRVGKRTLNTLEDEMRKRPEWLRELYNMRNNLMKYSVR